MPNLQTRAVAEVEALSTGIWTDLDENIGGIGWWSDYEISPAERFDLSDYLLGVVDGVGTHLGIAATYLDEYRAKRQTDDFQFRRWVRANTTEPLWKGLVLPDARKRKELMSAHLYAFFNAASSVLDTLAGTVIGVAGLDLPLVRADLGMFAPITSDPDYPTKAKRTAKSLAADPESRAAQLGLVRAFRTSLDQAGPTDWHLWLNQKRNQLAHRGGRLQLEAIRRKSRSWDPDRYMVLDREPDLTTTQSFRNNVQRDMDTVFLLEDQLTTMEGILRSLQTAVIGTVVPCKLLWERRRENPALIQQPASQWVQPKEDVSFPGYEPNPDVFKNLNTMVMNPLDGVRLSASQVLDNIREEQGPPPAR